MKRILEENLAGEFHVQLAQEPWPCVDLPLTLDVCPSPTCDCRQVHVTCPDPEQADAFLRFTVALDDEALLRARQLGENVVKGVQTYDTVGFLGDPGLGWCPECHSNVLSLGMPRWNGECFAIECPICHCGGDLEKDANGKWFDDYGGYVAIGCDTSVVTTCPTSIAQLTNPMYKNEVAINNDPTSASAAFYAVWAAALANGGSFSNIQPGIDFFANLNKIGNFVPGGSASTVASKATPILLWWDYLQDGLKAAVPNWKVIIPSDASIAAYYTQAITYDAPHPAAARLWEEYLYSTVGQNLFLQGNARPIELAAMIKAGTANKTWLAELPAAPKGGLTFPTQAQTDAAKATVAANWAAAISGS